MMVEGLGIAINTSGGPHYVDVPADYWAYAYIETLYNTMANGQRLMSGSPCSGGICFRPVDNIWRGEVSKVVELTGEYKGWLSGYGSGGGPDFWDVPSGSTFYSYIEKLYNAGAVQYRVEDNGAGNGGHYFVGWFATRAEIAMYLHELIYAAR